MRLLIVQDTDWIRRNPIQHTHLAERMSLRGHEVHVIDYEILWKEEGKREILSKRNEQEASRVVKGGKVKVIRPRIVKVPLIDYASMLITYKREIDRQIKEFKPDVVIGNDILTPMLAYRSAKKAGIPSVFYAIDIEHRLVPYRFLQPLGKLMERKNIKDADLVLSINEGLREYTIRMGAERNRTGVIRAGIDAEKYDPFTDGEDIRRHYGIAPSDKVLLFMGWLYPFSGLQESAEALAKLGRKDVRLLVVGDGDAFKELWELKDRLGLEGRMIMTGRKPFADMPKYLAAADACLLPARDNEIMRDIVPIKMYEYLAMGKPVIATKLHGVMLEFGEGNGVTYVDHPGQAVERAVSMLDSGEAETAGASGRRFVEGLKWESITDEFEKTLKCLAT